MELKQQDNLFEMYLLLKKSIDGGLPQQEYVCAQAYLDAVIAAQNYLENKEL